MLAWESLPICDARSIEQRRTDAKVSRFSGINTVQSNLITIARELEDAQGKVNKLNSKQSRASANKIEAATKNLQSATGM